MRASTLPHSARHSAIEHWGDLKSAEGVCVVELQLWEDVLVSVMLSLKSWMRSTVCALAMFLGMSHPRVVASKEEKVISLMQRLVAAAPIRRYHVERGGDHPSDVTERGRDIVKRRIQNYMKHKYRRLQREKESRESYKSTHVCTF